MLGTIYTDRWHVGGEVLLRRCGACDRSALHAELRLRGLVELAQLVDGPGWEVAFAEFQRRRQPNADAIAQMALENYVEMRDTVRDRRFLRAEAAGAATRAAPSAASSRATHGEFHPEIPYAEAAAAARCSRDPRRTGCGRGFDRGGRNRPGAPPTRWCSSACQNSARLTAATRRVEVETATTPGQRSGRRVGRRAGGCPARSLTASRAGSERPPSQLRPFAGCPRVAWPAVRRADARRNSTKPRPADSVRRARAARRSPRATARGRTAATASPSTRRARGQQDPQAPAAAPSHRSRRPDHHQFRQVARGSQGAGPVLHHHHLARAGRHRVVATASARCSGGFRAAPARSTRRCCPISTGLPSVCAPARRSPAAATAGRHHGRSRCCRRRRPPGSPAARIRPAPWTVTRV